MRYLSNLLLQQIGPKITLISGPRQVGKTTLARSLKKSHSYYNYDDEKSSPVFRQQSWDRQTEIVIFDELHKMKKWKLWLKGLYDSELFKKQFAVVTGSARLSHIKKVGDSLAGRFYEYRLHPFDLKELKGRANVMENYKLLLERGGFPEPLLKLNLQESRRWRRTITDVILRQDLFSVEIVKDIDSLELLIELLASRVGSTVSHNSLAEDLKISDLTVKRYLRILEDLYIVFRVSSFSKNISRGLSKSGKYYFYDLGRVQGGEAEKFENLTALALKKELDYIEDSEGLRTKLNFIRNKEKQEVDFLVQIEGGRALLYECKLNDASVSKNLIQFGNLFPQSKTFQLVAHLERRFDTKDGVHVERGPYYLEKLDLLKETKQIIKS